MPASQIPNTNFPSTRTAINAAITTLNSDIAAKADAAATTSALAGKAPTSHGHTIADTTGLQTALDAKADGAATTSALAGKAPSSHTHSAADINAGTLSPDRLATGTALQVVRRNAANTALECATISVGGGDMLAANNLSDIPNDATARTNLGLGDSDTVRHGRLGLGAAADASGTDTTAIAYIKRTGTKGSGVSTAEHVELTATPTNTEVVVTILGDVINTGSASGGVGHIVGVIGRATDTASGAIEMWGVEGRLQARGTAGTHAAVNGLAEFAGSTFAGRIIHGVRGRCDVLLLDLTTPLNEGATAAFYAQTPRGGDPAQRYSFLSQPGMQMLNLGPIRSRDNSNTSEVSFDHDGTDGNLRNTFGNFRIHIPAGNYAAFQDGLAVIPVTNGMPLGIDTNRWAGNFTQAKIGAGTITESGGLPQWNGAAWPGGGGGISQTLEALASIGAAGNTNVARPSGSHEHTVFASVGAGSGAYTHTVSINTTNSPVAGNTIRVALSLPASANPTIQIREGSAGGELLFSIPNLGATADLVIADFVWSGTDWILVTSTNTSGGGGGSGDMLKSENLSGLSNYGTARTNLGLGNVDNTTDLNKPVSTATQTALNSKAATSQTNEFFGGFISTPANKDYKVVVKAPHGGTITEVTTISASGTATLTAKVNTTALGGTANAVSSTEQSQAHSTANAFAAGDDIVLTVSANSSCADLSFTIKYTRTLS